MRPKSGWSKIVFRAIAQPSKLLRPDKWREAPARPLLLRRRSGTNAARNRCASAETRTRTATFLLARSFQQRVEACLPRCQLDKLSHGEGGGNFLAHCGKLRLQRRALRALRDF